MDIGNVRLYKLKKLSGLPNNITKIGIQANPFTYFLINKEPIRVGRNGIYEVDGINISSIYAAPLSTGSFIIDYKYLHIHQNIPNYILSLVEKPISYHLLFEKF